MRLLFIKLKSPCDVLLLSPTLESARAGYRDSVIWAAVPSGVEGVLDGCTALDRVWGVPVGTLLLDRWRENLRFLRHARRQRFDYAFELGGNTLGRWLCALSGARRRVANGCERLQCLPSHWRMAFNRISTSDWLYFHAVEKDYFTVNDCFPLGGRAPSLTFAGSRVRSWEGAPALGTFAMLDTGGPLEGDRWPMDRWAAVVTHLLRMLDHVVISPGTDAADRVRADELQQSAGPRVVVLPAALDWAQMAGLLHRAHLCVAGNNTMLHLAAACRCPSVALFGASPETRWHPWQSPHRLVVQPGETCPPTDPGYFECTARRSMVAVRVDDVLEACDEIIAGGRELDAG